jgi:hypothetical protein
MRSPPSGLAAERRGPYIENRDHQQSQDAMLHSAAHIDEIRALEEALHRPDVRHSRQAVEALLAEGFVEFGSSGSVYHRVEMIELLTREEENAGEGVLQADDYALTPISADAVLLTYRTRRRGSNGSVRHVLRSSIWKHDGARWQMLFHQGTVTATAI